MKLLEILRYELEYRLHSRSTWLYAAVLFGLSFMIIAGANDGDGPVNINAPSQLATFALGLSAFAIIISAAIFGDAAVRDSATQMDPLIYSMPIRKGEYLGGRFLAALLANACVLLAIPLGFAAAMLLPPDGPMEYGPFRVAAYAQPFLLLVLPNLVFSGIVLFAIGILARAVIPVYLGAVGLMVSFGLAGNYLTHFENRLLVALSDPLGINAISATTAYWTAAEKNARVIGFPGALLWNRLAWLILAAVVFAALYRAFRFEHHAGGGRRRSAESASLAAAGAPTTLQVPRVSGSFGFRTTARQVGSVARNALTEIVTTRAFLIVVLGSVILTLLWGWNVGSTVFETATWPATFLVAEVALSMRALPIMYVLIALYAGELVWKERDSGVAEIADAAPVPETVALSGRFAALVALLAVIQAAVMIGGMLIQGFHGYFNFEVGLYVRILFGINLVNFMLLAVLAMTIHVVVNHKYVGHMLVLMVLVAFQLLDRAGLVRHFLLLYGRDPGWTYSDMNGFGPFIEPFAWFKLYWAGWALLLAVIAALLWVRGREIDMRRRLRTAQLRLTRNAIAAAGLALLMIIAFGGFIFYNTNVLNEYHPGNVRAASQADYEKRYAHFENRPQPTIVTAGLRVEIYPEEQAVDVRGTFRLENRTGVRIDSLHVYVDPSIDTRSITLDRAATAVLSDTATGYRIYTLARALDVGEAMHISFDVGFRQRGFPNRDIQTDVVSNGAYFNRSWLPFIGYQPFFELQAEEARSRYGLPPQPPMPGPAEVTDVNGRESWTDADVVDVETVIGTASDQIAITPGVLRERWTENGRSYFRYRTEVPIAFGNTVFSGKYEVVEDRWNDVALQIFHHPGHTYNLDRMVRSMKASLAYFSEQFGPYPYSQLRIVEIPRYGKFGRAHPGTIAFTEDNLLTRVDGDLLDMPFYATAHETAHTWWGGLVRGAANVRGGAMLSESLANYSAMMVTEHTYGLGEARRVYDFQMNRYLTMRARNAQDVPLLQVEGQPWIFYGKGAVVMYLLRDYIGADAVNSALRRFVDEHRAGVPPYPTSLDLFAELKAVTPDSLRYLLTDLFETVTLWDVKTESVTVAPAGNGEYVVTLDVVARKARADRDGNETDAPMNDLVEIGVFAAGGIDGDQPPLHLRHHRIVSGRQRISVTVKGAPASAGIDPYRMLIDRNRDDNLADAASSTGSADGGS